MSNLFVLHRTPADYFQPAIAISGALSALGLAPWLALLVWKPVAVIACFWVVRAFVRAAVPGVWPRRAALVLALFFGSFTVVYGSFGALGDLMPGFLSWGYVFALLAVAALTAALLAYDRAERTGRRIWAPAALGALAGLMHPWHGELLVAIVLGVELVRRARRQAGGLVLPGLTLAGAGLPLVYYALLGRADESWRLARVASKHAFPLWAILLALAPLLVCALPAYRRPAPGFVGAATRTWPLAALAVYGVSASALGATPLHAFQGITIPLAVLAVQGVHGLGRDRGARAWVPAAAAVIAFTVPAGAYEMASARELVAPRSGSGRFIAAGERAALRHLAADPRPGGVIARSYLGALVPAATGRRTLVGDCLWSQPGCSKRLVAVRELFTGAMAPAAARRVVSRSHARFLLADCRGGADLAHVLGRLVSSVERFGCARIYVLRG